jgi:hypothetical protein
MNEIKLTIPTDINELTVHQYVRLKEIALDKDRVYEDFEFMIEVAKPFGISAEQVYKMDVKSFTDLSDAIIELIRSVNNHEPNPVYDKKKKLYVGGILHAIDFSIDEDMLMLEFADILHTLKAEYPKHLPQLLAILIRPYDKEKKEIEPYDNKYLPERIAFFNDNLLVRDFYPVINFFFQFSIELQKWITDHYLELEKNPKIMQKVNNGQ